MKTSICRLLSTPLQSSKAFNQAFSVLLIKVFKVMMSSCSPFSWTGGTRPSMFHHVFSQLKPQLSLVHPSNLRKPTLDTHSLSFKNNIIRKLPVFPESLPVCCFTSGLQQGGPASSHDWTSSLVIHELGGPTKTREAGRLAGQFHRRAHYLPLCH